MHSVFLKYPAALPAATLIPNFSTDDMFKKVTEKKISPLCSLCPLWLKKIIALCALAAYFTFLKTSGRFASHCFKLSL